MSATSPEIDLAALIADTEGEIVRLVQDRDPSTHGLYEMVRYHLALDGSGASGGKRIRPLLGLLSYASIAGEHQRALPGAAAVELGHNFSLVHDDIEDGDVERRHRPTLWSVHGIPQAINAGDTLFSLSRIALHRLSDLGFPDHTVLRLMRLYDETCLALCEGQYIDIQSSASDELMSVELYFDMIGRKTASLIAASIEAGAVLATDDDEVIARYRGFGWALGIAFQLNDDLLGIWGAEQATGKEPSDLAHRKQTLPVIYAHEHADPADRATGIGLRQAGTRSRRCRGRHRDPGADRARTTRATQPAATATRRWPNSMRRRRPAARASAWNRSSWRRSAVAVAATVAPERIEHVAHELRIGRRIHIGWSKSRDGSRPADPLHHPPRRRSGDGERDDLVEPTSSNPNRRPRGPPRSRSRGPSARERAASPPRPSARRSRSPPATGRRTR